MTIPPHARILYSSLLLIGCIGVASCRTPDQVAAPEPVPEPPPPTEPTPVAAEVTGMLALGDSYTIGTSLRPGLAWPGQLADSLAVAGDTLSTLDVVAGAGWTTSDLLEELGNTDLDPPYGLVALMIGVNNQCQGLALADYVLEFTALVDTALAMAEGGAERVVVLSIPDYGVTPVGRNFGAEQAAAGVERFNAAARAVVDSLDLNWLDVTTVSREALEDPSLVARDGLHFSAEMHRRWVGLLLPVVRRIL